MRAAGSVALLSIVLAPACEPAPAQPDAKPASSAEPAPTAAAARPPVPWKAAAIAHGGVGSPASRSDGCRSAVDRALDVLAKTNDPLAAAVEGIMVLEDDPRFNAGTGSRVRLDGKTVQMDASIMTSEGRFGAVAGVEQVKNPIRVARAVLDTPHLLFAGDGATRFARAIGEAPYDPATDEMRDATRRIQQRLLERDPAFGAWSTFDWRRYWNFDVTPEQAGLGAPDGGAAPASTAAAIRDAGTDTVGLAVRTTDGRFVVALSTGGTAITLRGRVGDVPILGAGLFASPHGVAAATGTGERIIETSLARATVDRLASGKSAQHAADAAVATLLRKADVGMIVLTPDAMASAADRQMAWAGREEGGAWSGPPGDAGP